ncbi:MAG: type II secretion system protein [Patescibacteria group bacterium]
MKKLKLEKGFTMVELIVAMSVFSIAISLATGAFARAIKTQRILNNLMSVNSNASLTVEQMAREIRTGYNFGVSQDAGAECGNILTFVRSRDGATVSYKWNEERKSIDFQEGDGNFLPLTATNVFVQNLCFLKTESDPWRITFYLTLGSTDPRLRENILNFQTTISSRILPQVIQQQ